MNKRVVGIYNRQEAVVLEIDKLKALGHNENSIFVLAKDHHRAHEIVNETGVQVEDIPKEGTPEPKGAGVFSRMFYALDYDTQHSGVAAVLKSAGITEDEVGIYVRRLEEGDLVILANAEAPRQPHSDELDVDVGFSKEEQSMQYYSSAVNEGNTNAPVQDSYAQNQNQQFQGQTDLSFDDMQNKEEIYVEHIYFESQTPPMETNDEELIRIPITEERVRVITEKVVTGEIVVRKRII